LAIVDRGLSLVRAVRPLRGLLIVLLIAGPWAVAIGLATEGRFFAEALGGDMIGKIGEGQESHGAPPSYYLALVWVTFWPASLVLPAAAAFAFARRKAPEIAFLIAWAAPAWIVFELASTKLPHYVLPLYPALALLAAHVVLSAIGARGLVRLGAGIWFIVGLALAAALVWLPGEYADAGRAPIDGAAAALVLAASLAILAAAWGGRVFAASLGACALSAALAWLLLLHTLPGLDRLAVSTRLAEAVRAAGGCAPCAPGEETPVITGYSEPSFVFLQGTDTPLLAPAATAQRLSEAPGRLAIVEADAWAPFQAALKARGIEVEALATVRGLNYSRGEDVALTLYRSTPRDAAPGRRP
ncbi:MAG: glycosyltransferase family 39 protein, partial [Pseudomonadota bacterium]